MDFPNSAITASNPSSSESLRESSLAEAEGVDSAFGLGSFLIGVLIVSFCFAPSFSSFFTFASCHLEAICFSNNCIGGGNEKSPLSGLPGGGAIISSQNKNTNVFQFENKTFTLSAASCV